MLCLHPLYKKYDILLETAKKSEIDETLISQTKLN